MIIGTHTHVWSYPALLKAREQISTTEDLVSFRTRYPELYARTLREEPIDNSVLKFPDRLYGLMRIGHDQEAAYEYLEDPTPVRNASGDMVSYCIEGVWEKFLFVPLQKKSTQKKSLPI